MVSVVTMLLMELHVLASEFVPFDKCLSEMDYLSTPWPLVTINILCFYEFDILHCMSDIVQYFSLPDVFHLT